jgi:hypothetical protein
MRTQSEEKKSIVLFVVFPGLAEKWEERVEVSAYVSEALSVRIMHLAVVVGRDPMLWVYMYGTVCSFTAMCNHV